MRERKISRLSNSNPIRDATTCCWHNVSKQWCMVTAYDIDFHAPSDEELHANDALFTAHPINEEKFLQEDTIQRDKTKDSMPVALKDLQFVNENWAVEHWRFRTLKNQEWIKEQSSQRQIKKILNGQQMAMRLQVMKMKQQIHVCFCIFCFVFILYIISTNQ